MSTNQNNIFEEIETVAESQNKYIKVQPGESKILTFSTEKGKIRIVDSEYQGKTSKRVEYDVLNEGGNPKTITFTMSWSLNLNEFLKAGHTKLKVIRKGSGLDTSFTFVPV